MNGLGLSALLVLSVAILFAPRRWALLAMMTGVIYLTQAQAISVFGVNLFALRLLEIVGLIRICLRREFRSLNLSPLDRALFGLYAFTTIVFLLRSDRGQAYAIGTMVDVISSYFIFRCLIRSFEEFVWFLRSFALVLVPFAVLLSFEMMTHRNPFAVIGGTTFVERDGRIRCMGSFRHPSLLGTLGASFAPLYLGLIFGQIRTARALLGLGLCLFIVFCSNSGGPLSATVVGLLGWCFWVARRRMVQLRWALVGIVAMLAAAMKAPIWYLPAKVSAITGGDGWHRSYLMDVAFHDLASWWFVGMDIANTKEWFPYQVAATGAADITNQFIAFGLNAGVLAIALLVLVLVRAFGVVGQAMAVARTQAVGPSDVEYILWGLGCTMVVHVSTWLGITYNFDQTYCIWTLHLAALGSISQDLARGGGPLAGTSEKTSSRSAGKLLYRPRSRGRAAAA